MKSGCVEEVFSSDLALWKKMKPGIHVCSVYLELTARCNNNCRHCYINLPANDRQVQAQEMSLSRIKSLVDQAADMGATWCLLTGGEPLLRKDFFEIYMYLKRKGLFVQVFTNANLITPKHAELFRRYPPRDIEVSVYGVSREVYERVTRVPGSYKKFRRGVRLLLDNGIQVRFKAMALRSNVQEFPAIIRFCRERSKDYFRFDPFLHFRYDRNKSRNLEIRQERLLPKEVVALEALDFDRLGHIVADCDMAPVAADSSFRKNIFHCGVGKADVTIGYDGVYRLCNSLFLPGFRYDLQKVSLQEAWRSASSKARRMRSGRKEFVEMCGQCQIHNLCSSCPAHSDLETGEADAPVRYFCDVAHARAAWLAKNAR